LQELLPVEVRESPRHDLARRSNHLSNFFVS